MTEGRDVAWMQDRVMDAVGIHMSMPPKNRQKKGSSAPQDVAGEDEDIDISGWTPPPHMMAQWAKAPDAAPSPPKEV